MDEIVTMMYISMSTAGVGHLFTLQFNETLNSSGWFGGAVLVRLWHQMWASLTRAFLDITIPPPAEMQHNTWIAVYTFWKYTF